MTMRLLPLLLALLVLSPSLAGCGAVDASRGASGFPDVVMNSREGFIPMGTMEGGTMMLNRERPESFVNTDGVARPARGRPTPRIWE